MQLQGEVQEFGFGGNVASCLPFDMINQVGKGVREQIVSRLFANNFGQECVRCYESKRTNAFAVDWIEKLKADIEVLRQILL